MLFSIYLCYFTYYNQFYVSVQFSYSFNVSDVVVWREHEGNDETPNHDLPSQEKNQCWTVYWQKGYTLYTKLANQAPALPGKLTEQY